tara:strand:- start:12245 stop:12580 length:336 start_codon:yes stop_codon:yes gene_type:complete
MRWPWVSRHAYDLVVEQNTKMLDELLRLRRREAGMPEQPRPDPRPEAQQPAEIPDEIEALINEFQSEGVRVVLREQYRIRVANGATPEKLHGELLRQIDEPEDGTHSQVEG